MKQKLLFAVVCLVSIVVGVLTPGIRQEALSTTAEQQKAVLKNHPEWKGATIQRISLVEKEDGARSDTQNIDSMLIRRGEKTLGIMNFYGTAAQPARLNYKFIVGNTFLHKWWVLILLIGVQALLWWKYRYRWLMVGATTWAAGWIILSGTPYIRINQLWAEGGAGLALLWGLWAIYRSRKTSQDNDDITSTDKPSRSIQLIEKNKQKINTIIQSAFTRDLQQRQWLILFVLGLMLGSLMIFFKATSLDGAWATLEGAQEMAHGNSIYGNSRVIPFSDTYPPLMYLFYIPSLLFGPEVQNMYYPIIAVTVWSYIIYLFGAIIAYRKEPRLAIAWLWAVPILLAASSGSNDLLVSMFLLFAALGWKWGYPLAVGVKAIPLAWFGVSWKQYGLPGFIRLGLLGLISLILVIVLAGLSGIGDMITGISFQSRRQSWNDVATLFGWNWWHPVTRGLLVGLALLAFSARKGEYALWALVLGCAALLTAQYSNILYSSWLWVLVLGVVYNAGVIVHKPQRSLPDNSSDSMV